MMRIHVTVAHASAVVVSHTHARARGNGAALHSRASTARTAPEHRRRRHRHLQESHMKVTALSLWKSNGDDREPHVLGKAEDVAEFGFFQRPSVREMLVFISRTVAKRTAVGARQSVAQDAYMVHVTNKGGLIAVAVVDAEYPSRSAFCVLSAMLEEYETRVVVGDAWRALSADDSRGDEMLEGMLIKYQDPSAADKILKIQRELDDTKVVLHKTIDSVLARGEKLDNLVDKSTDLSLASQMFYKQAKKQNQCCTMM